MSDRTRGGCGGAHLLQLILPSVLGQPRLRLRLPRPQGFVLSGETRWAGQPSGFPPSKGAAAEPEPGCGDRRKGQGRSPSGRRGGLRWRGGTSSMAPARKAPQNGLQRDLLLSIGAKTGAIRVSRLRRRIRAPGPVTKAKKKATPQ